MLIGMSTSCFFGKEVVENSIDVMAKMGVKYIEIFLNTMSEYEERYVQELKKKIDGYGMEVLSVHPQGTQFEIQMYTPYERTVNDAENIFRKVLKAAQILGAKRYIYHGGMNIKPKRTPFSFERIGKITGRCARIASEYGLDLAYENVHWCWFHFPEFAEQLLNYCQEENLCFNLDIKQAAQSGYAYERYIETMGKRLKSVHLCDYAKKEEWVEPEAPFKGEAVFENIKNKLHLSGFDGPAILELYSSNYDNYEELKSIFERMTQIFC